MKTKHSHFWQQCAVLSCCLLTLGACVKPTILVNETKVITPVVTAPKIEPVAQTITGIGPYTEFSGRLLVIQKAKRWQVMVNWKANSPEQGWLRLHHAASSRIIEIKWHNNTLQTRDNHDNLPLWKKTKAAYLQQQGINISPQDLATFLLGDIPKGFTQKTNNEWRGHRGKSLIRVVWNPNSKRFMIMDMYKGSKIVLIIS